MSEQVAWSHPCRSTSGHKVAADGITCIHCHAEFGVIGELFDIDTKTGLIKKAKDPMQLHFTDGLQPGDEESVDECSPEPTIEERFLAFFDSVHEVASAAQHFIRTINRTSEALSAALKEKP